MRVAGVRAGQLSPYRVTLRGQKAQIFRHQLVLRLEMAVERHFVCFSGLGDGLHPHGMDAMAIE